MREPVQRTDDQLSPIPGSGESSGASSSRSIPSSASSVLAGDDAGSAPAAMDLASAVSVLQNMCDPRASASRETSPRSMPLALPPDPGPSTPARLSANGVEYGETTPRGANERGTSMAIAVPRSSSGLVYNSDPLLAGSPLDTRFGALGLASTSGPNMTPPRPGVAPRSPSRSTSDSTLNSPELGRPPVRRARSRHGSRAGDPASGMSYASRMSFSSLAALQTLAGWTDDTRVRDVVMTPTTAEWRAADPMRAGRKTPISSDTELSDDDEPADSTLTPSGATRDFAHAVALSQLRSVARSSLDGSRTMRRDTARDPDDVSSEDDEEGRAPHGELASSPMPRRFSAALSVHSVSSVGSNHSIADIAVGPPLVRSSSLRQVSSPIAEAPSFASTPTNGLNGSILTPPAPLPLDRIGPIDPRSYSAKTEARSIRSFVVADGDTGKGAYGSVRKARERSTFTGEPVDPMLMIKYIVKERIIADCWKKHKILGPIPVEIHVLDHIRRVPFKTFLPADAPQSSLPVPQTGHPNIGSMLDFFEDQEHYYMVMPHFGDGQDLFDYVDAAPDGLPAAEVRSIFGQVADGLAFLHAMGVVHRDIKDENVILDGHGNVALIDFGSAAYIRSGDRRFDTFSLTLEGTLDFAAPEVLRSERYDGKMTDMWALGVLAYVLICGECPFWNAQEAMQGLGPGTRAAAALQAKLAQGAADGQPLDLAIDLVHRCLEVAIEDRPSAQQVCLHRLYAGDAGWSGPRGWLS